MRRVTIGILATIQLAVVLLIVAPMTTGSAWFWTHLVTFSNWVAPSPSLAYLVPLAAAMGAIVLLSLLAWLVPQRLHDAVVTWQMLSLEMLIVLAPFAKVLAGLVGASTGGGLLTAYLSAVILSAGAIQWIVPSAWMGRFQMGVALLIEVGLVTVLAVALIYEGLGQGPFFWAYVLGTITALTAAFAWVMPRKLLAKVVTHGALLIGCLVFAFPFVWMISTSAKYNEKMFVFPPKWLPSIPPAVSASPYATADLYRPVSRPEGMTKPRWEAFWPKVERVLWDKGRRLLGSGRGENVDPAQLREALTHGLWSSASAGVAEDVWLSTDDADRIDAVLARVDAERVDEVWGRIRRSIALRDITIKDVDLNDYTLGAGGDVSAAAIDLSQERQAARRSYLHLWQSGDGAITCTARKPTAQPAEKPLLAVRYDFSRGERVSTVADLPLPMPSERLLSLTIPVRQDRSWHRLRFEIEIDGRRYTNEDSLFLGQYRWQEITLKFKDKDAADERDIGVWPMVVTQQSGAFDQPGKFRLRMIVERSSRAAATWHKYTDSYRRAYYATEHRWNYLANSIYLVVLTVFGQVLSCSLVAYAFARLKWPGRNVLFAIMLATMMLPPQVTMIPVFMIFRSVGWYNTLKALWVPSFLGGAFFIFMLRQFMKTIPVELEDAAKIDGCGFFGVYWRIILPLMKPALAAVAIFTFQATWNNFMGPLIYLNDQRLYPLALGLFEFRSQHTTEFGMLMAASTLVTLPMVAVFFLAQKYFIQGVTLTGMKG